jgi:hypothetical protein
VSEAYKNQKRNLTVPGTAIDRQSLSVIKKNKLEIEYQNLCECNI